MIYSLNEVDALAKRAARGGGYSWGLAEEAGRAARWLSAQGLDGCQTLALVLRQNDGRSMQDLSPLSLTGDWTGLAGCLCPLMAGATLSDSAEQLGTGKILMCNVMFPALILPFAAAVARQRQTVVNVTWSGLAAATDGVRLNLVDSGNAVTVSTAEHLQVWAGGRLGVSLPCNSRTTPDAADWTTLSRFAARTYAPATEASRRLGAGAGLSDND